MTIVPLSVKVSELFIITCMCVYIFSRIYLITSKRSEEDAIYMAAMNQTLNGGGIIPINTIEKFTIAFQCVLAFLMSTGLIVVSLSL